ncbi:unnamed protein product [Rotaria socialis]|uniref:Uncharacterized protein n=1 Tax=Rotaria socialis TaxID=392032 RepID=A0A817NND2_9BILA|nr:unnamed protein product [Rotaria socialis]
MTLSTVEGIILQCLATTTASTSCTDPKTVSLSSPTTDSNLILTPRTPTLNSISNINVRKRPTIDSFSPPRKKRINLKTCKEVMIHHHIILNPIKTIL